MNKYFDVILVSIVCFLGACTTPQDSVDGPTTAPPYLGQTSPGDSALLFAPGLVSLDGRYEYGVSFAPEGNELLFSAQYPESGATLMHFVAADTGWIGPTEARLSEGQRKEEMEAFFSPDGRRIYFAAYNEGLDVRIWTVDRTQDGWHSPRMLGSPVADEPAFYPTITTEGAVYYANLVKRRVFRAEASDDSTWVARDTGLEAMHAFIAPDESFALLDFRAPGERTEADIFVSFRQPDGTWSPLVDLGPGVNTEFAETCPSLSPDGRFIFFSRYNEPDNISNVYWVSSDLIPRARERLDARN